ncbi:MAG: cyanophycin synthetase [Candidatus Daviesbacteria bacterium]|nr:cyanophycin synthetase [Candidatus Daviesbacteria bacterium]
MISKIKQALYFPIATYFRFFAQIQLFFWKPKIIVITGSNAKTTLLHLLESQIGDRAKYTHQGNSSYGIPFDILDLKRETLTLDEWPIRILLAPFKAFRKPPEQKLYIVEADCDRPNEGKFLATLLQPDATLWVSISKSHSMNFEKPVEENIALEFGYFLEYTKNLAIINGDAPLIKKQLSRTKAKTVLITQKDLQKYDLRKDKTEFKIKNKVYKFKFLLPRESFYQIMATLKILDYLKLHFDPSFSKFVLPPGRCSVFQGIKNTTLIDSSYNANLSSMKVILEMFNQIPAGKKWAVLGDMLEQGTEEQLEHEELAEIVLKYNLEKIILMGPRVSKYTYPKLKYPEIVSFINPKETLDYLNSNLKGGEIILFKGARFLEGVIEHLLKNKEDVSKLCRREKIWEKRRSKWGL